jgi:zinc protease
MFRAGLAALLLALCGQPAAAQDGADVTTLAVTTAQVDAAHAWGHPATDVPFDADVRFGVLGNGMKYAIRRNGTPRNGVAMRLRFDIGSLAEQDDQRGLAHFLEHMAFNGSTNVPEGEMVRLLERYGLAFGADTNASTGFDQTIYMLDLPRNDADVTDTALMLFREIAGELTIAPEAVDRERGVILSEARARDTHGLRSLIDALGFVYRGTRVPDRLPIGTTETISTSPAQRIRDFYDAYYRPERATLVIVGDIDVDAMEERVRARFADWRGRGIDGPDPDIGQLDFSREASAASFVHPAIAETVGIVRLRPYERRTDSRAQRLRNLAEYIADAVFERRMERIALSSDSPTTGAGLSATDAWETARILSLDVSVRDGAWRDAMRIGENELRRAVEHGFTAAEVAEQIAQLRTSARDAAAGASTRQSNGLAARLLGAADGDRVVTTPAFDAELVESFAASATAETISNAFRQMVDGYGAPLVRVTAKNAIDGGDTAILQAYQSATDVAVAPPDTRADVRFAYTTSGMPGAVVADDRIDDFGIRRVRFANNVMLNIRRTDFEASTARITVRIDGGSLLAPAADPAPMVLANLMTLGGLEAHSYDDMQNILAGQSTDFSFGSSTDAFLMSATIAPDDMAQQAAVFAATLMHPGYRPQAIDLLRRVLPQQYAASDATPAAVFGRDAPAILADGDRRLVTQPLERMMALTWDDFRPIAADALAHGAIEIGVVGAVDEQAVIAAMATTLGALPLRRAAFDARDSARVRRFAQDRTTRTFIHRGEADQAIVASFWQARDDSDLTQSLHIDLLAGAMQILLTDELRERLGQTYSPNASADLSSEFPGFGTISASSNVAYGDIAASEASIDAIADQLVSAPIGADLLRRVRQPMLERMATARRQNGYWLPYVSRASTQPERLDRSRRAIEIVEAATPADIQRMAQAYLRADRRIRMRAISAQRASQPAP